MKRTISISMMALSLLAMVSCGNCKKDCKHTESNVEETAAKADANVMTVIQVLENAEQNVGKEIDFKGKIKHVCSHSGRRAFVYDANGEQSIRVEAKGTINGFSRELTGVDIIVHGVLKEHQLSEEKINEMEAQKQAKLDEEGATEEHCQTEMSNITNMRAWMKENNKNYYSIYYVDGLDYEVVE